MSSLPSLSTSPDASTDRTRSGSSSDHHATSDWFVTPPTPPQITSDGSHHNKEKLFPTSPLPTRDPRIIFDSTSPFSRLSVPSPSRPKKKIRLPNYILRWDQVRPLDSYTEDQHRRLECPSTMDSSLKVNPDAQHILVRRHHPVKKAIKLPPWKMFRLNINLDRRLQRILPCRNLGRRHQDLANLCSPDPSISPEGVSQKRKLLEMQDETPTDSDQAQCRFCSLVVFDCFRRSETVAAIEERARMRSTQSFSNPPWLVAGSGWRGRIRTRTGRKSAAGTAGITRSSS